MKKIFYHVTDSEKLDSIMRKGLVPMIGEHSESVGEETPAVYLCDLNSTTIWSVILNKSVLLQVFGLDESELTTNDFYSSGGYAYHKIIPPENIRVVDKALDIPPEIYKSLCIKYALGISELINKLIGEYNRKDARASKLVMRNALAVSMDNYMDIMNRLPYDEYYKDVFEELWKYSQDGEYVLFDLYDPNKGAKMFEQLLNYPEDETYKTRVALNEFINNKFKGVLELHEEKVKEILALWGN